MFILASIVHTEPEDETVISPLSPSTTPPAIVTSSSLLTPSSVIVNVIPAPSIRFNLLLVPISPPNATFWEAITTPTSLIDNVGTATASANLNYQVYERVIYPFSKQGFGTLCSTAALDCCSDCERSEDVLAYEQLGVYVDGMNIADQRGQYLQGEKIARDAQTALSRCL